MKWAPQTATKGSPPTHSAAVDASSNRTTAWIYDEAGNVLGDTRHAYAFDANNKIVSMDSGTATYAYDAQGNRVKKTVGGVTTYYFWGYEYVSGWSKLHIFLGGRKLAEYSGGTTRFFHLNHLGTPVARTDMSGAQDASWSHYPFGEEWQSSNSGSDQYTFTGHLQDAESENMYAGARYYAGASGRWSSVDPVQGNPLHPQSANRYSYVLNDPINLIDSSGAFFELVNCRSFNFLPGVPDPFEFCQIVLFPGPSGVSINFPVWLPLSEEVRNYLGRVAELLSTPIARESISAECKALFGEFIEAARQDPSLIEGRPWTGDDRELQATACRGGLWTSGRRRSGSFDRPRRLCLALGKGDEYAPKG
ncbi:MAG TPA: RHS repeat-associated core domain-containing protein [Acidobacteriota bacterium]|nr:RHS repeat-associated core domain-containing protein [Acidobacteriota bacterium]